MVSVLIMISMLFVGAMLWAGQHALIVLPLATLVWVALLVLELRDVRLAPIARRAVASSRAHRAHRARRDAVSV